MGSTFIRASRRIAKPELVNSVEPCWLFVEILKKTRSKTPFLPAKLLVLSLQEAR